MSTAVAQPSDNNSAPAAAEGAEPHASDKAGSTSAPAARATPRYATATATSTVARTTASARSVATLNKQPARSPTSAHRPTASTSTIGHRSAPSVGASEDDQKPKSASRRESTVISNSAGAAGDKKTGTIGSTVASRRSTVGVGAASPKPAAPRTRTGASDSVAAIRAGLTRGTSSSNAAADARKRPPAPGIVTGASRPSTRTSVRSEAHPDSPKILDELTFKLTERDKEIESLKVELGAFESTVTELRQQLEGSSQQLDEGESPSESKATPDGSKTDYDAAIRDLEAQLQEKAEKLRTVDDELIEAVRIKDEGGEALEALKKELENLKVQNEEKLKATETQLEQTRQDYAAQVEKLQASIPDKADSDKADSDKTDADKTDADLRLAFEAGIQNLQDQVDELTASKADLESTINAITSERDALTSKLSDLENEISDVKSRLAISETAAKSAEASKDDEKSVVAKIQSDLTNRETELESARKVETELQNTIGDMKATLTGRDEEISSLKTMHDERLKQISQDYENEIESLRGDAFFKRKFEELEKLHSDLQASLTEETEKHTNALAESEERRSSALSSLESKGLEYEEQLASMRRRHDEELTAAKNQALETLDGHAKELESIKARYDEQLRLALADGEATSVEQNGFHEKVLDDLKKLHEEEKQGLLAAHQSTLTVTSSQHAEELAALHTKLEEVAAQLENAKSTSAEEYEVSKQELLSLHAAEIEKLTTAHADAMAALKEEGLQITQKLEELTVAYTQMETSLSEAKALNASFEATLDEAKAQNASSRATLDEAKAQSASLEEQLSLQTSTNATLQASLKTVEEQLSLQTSTNATLQASLKTVEEQLSLQSSTNATLRASLKAAQEHLVFVQAEADDVGQQLALEKVERMTTLAELDAVQTAKPDTTAINTLKTELIATTKTFQDALTVVKAELKSTRDNLADMEERYTATRQSLILTSKDLDELRITSEMKEKTAHADYSDLNDSMTALVEEASKKVKESEMNAEQLKKNLVEADIKNGQLQAQLKIKDAELAEAEVGSHAFYLKTLPG